MKSTKPKATRAPGAGRPATDPSGAKQPGSYRLPPDVVALIREAAEGQSAYLEAAVRYYAARNDESLTKA